MGLDTGSMVGTLGSGASGLMQTGGAGDFSASGTLAEVLQQCWCYVEK
jgi:hypothetical protein